MPEDQQTRPRARATREPAVSKAVLAFSWLGGAIVWSIFQVLAYAIASSGCTLGFGSDQVSMAVLILALLTAAISAAAAFAGRREGQRGESSNEEDAGDRGVSAFTGSVAVILNGFFAFLIIYDGIAALVLRPC